MRALLSLNKYFWRYKKLFFLGIICVTLTNYFRVLSPQITRYITNDVFRIVSNTTDSNVVGAYHGAVNKIAYFLEKKESKTKILYCGCLLFLLAIISGFFLFMMRQTIIVMSRKIEFDQKNEIFKHLLSLNQIFFKNNRIGDLMNKIAEDVSRVRMYTGPALMYFINLIVTLGFCLYNMFASHAGMTIVALAPLPILAFTIYFVNNIINKKSEKAQILLSDLTSKAQETFSGIRVIKSFFKEKDMAKGFNEISNEYKKVNLSLAKTEALYFPSMALLIGMSILFTIFYAAYLISTNQLPLSDIGLIPEFVLYIQMLTFPVSAIGWTASMIQRANVSQKRILELTNNNSLQQKNENSKKIDLQTDFIITFKNVNYTYEDTKIKALNNINLQIKSKQKIGIVGKTGSGKSTLVQLLMNHIEPTSGELLLNNEIMSDLNIESLRTQIAYVPQESILFSDTIINNINIGVNEKNINFDELVEATKLASIHLEIEQMENGYETIVGERGVTLSGGQKQRISIARALIRKSPILIMDDNLSAVDNITEKLIKKSMQEFMPNQTVFTIAHKLSVVQDSDLIIVMANGSITEKGTHAQLLNNKNGWYFAQWEIQNSNV